MATIKGNNKHLAGNPKYQNFSPDLEVEVKAGGNYTVYPKELPDPTPHPTKSGNVRWFNSFGVKGADGEDADVEYTVTLQKLPDDTELYYRDRNKAVRRIEDQDIEQLPGNRIRFTLAIGDPPTGVFP